MSGIARPTDPTAHTVSPRSGEISIGDLIVTICKLQRALLSCEQALATGFAPDVARARGEARITLADSAGVGLIEKDDLPW